MTVEPLTEAIAAVGSPRSDIRQRATEIEEQRRVPQDLVDAMRERGFFHLGLPRWLGGLELNPVRSAQVIEELAAADGSVGWIAMAAAQATWYSTFLDDEDVAAIWRDGGVVAGTARASGRALAVENPEPGYFDVRPVAVREWERARHLVHGRMRHLRRRPAEDRRRRQLRHTRALPASRGRHYPRHLTHDGPPRYGQPRLQRRADLRPSSRGFQMLVTPPRQPWACPGGEPLVFMNHGTHALGVARASIEGGGRDADQEGLGRTGAQFPPAPTGHDRRDDCDRRVGPVIPLRDGRSLMEVSGGGRASPHLRARTRLATSHAVKSSMTGDGPGARFRRDCPDLHVERPRAAIPRDIHTAAAHVMVGTMTFEAAGRVNLGQPAQFPFF